jgi:tetratricopeptide (TPR) repeat protein
MAGEWPSRGRGRPMPPGSERPIRRGMVAPRRAHWVSRPWIDLLVGCGGWSAPFLLVGYLFVESQGGQWAAVFYALALVCNYPHYMATIHRAYARLEDRSAYRLFTHYVTAGLLVAGVAAHVWPALLPWLFTAYVMWSPWHYAGQNFGLSMMFLRRADVDVSARERQWLYAAFVASYVLLLAAFNQGASRDRLILSLGLPDSFALSIEAVAAIVFIGGALLAYVSLSRRAPLRSLLPALILCSTQALWFVVPVLVSRMSSTPSPQLSYSTGVLALMHSAQYLWITQHYARRESVSRSGLSAWSQWRYWALLVFGGMALFVPAPWAASLIGHADFTSSALIVAAVVNIHHFVLDGVVWKLRNPRVSHALVSLDSPAMQPTLAQARPPAHSTRRRVMLVAAAVALVALALVDQVRYVLTSQSVDAAALEVARALNPHDSRVHLKLATAANRSGARDAAERSLRHAIDANPHDVRPRQEMVRLLIEADRLDDAYRANTALLETWPTDVDALINGGVLAQRLGDINAAAMWWRRGLGEAENRADVHLYLAELLDAAARPAEALPHYQRHLELTVASRPADPDARRVALVVIKLGDALSRTGRTDTAAGQYQLAARIARASGLSDVEALAVERLTTARH